MLPLADNSRNFYAVNVILYSAYLPASLKEVGGDFSGQKLLITHLDKYIYIYMYLMIGKRQIAQKKTTMGQKYTLEHNLWVNRSI